MKESVYCVHSPLCPQPNVSKTQRVQGPLCRPWTYQVVDAAGHGHSHMDPNQTRSKNKDTINQFVVQHTQPNQLETTHTAKQLPNITDATKHLGSNTRATKLVRTHTTKHGVTTHLAKQVGNDTETNN